MAYDGEWQDGQMHGVGVILSLNGRKKICQFDKGIRVKKVKASRASRTNDGEQLLPSPSKAEEKPEPKENE